MWPLKKRISLKESGIFEDFTDCHGCGRRCADDGRSIGNTAPV